MERIKILSAVFILILFRFEGLAHSDVELVDPALAPQAVTRPSAADTIEPDSFFGSAPADPARRDWFVFNSRSDNPTLNSPSGGSRAPASLVFEGEAWVQERAPARVAPAPGSQASLQTSVQKDVKDPGSVILDNKKGVQEVALIAGDLGFFPKTVFVTRNIPVRIFVTGASRNALCLMMDSFNVRKQIRSQKIEEITFTPTVPGLYRFYCPVNGTEGTMVVKEIAVR